MRRSLLIILATLLICGCAPEEITDAQVKAAAEVCMKLNLSIEVQNLVNETSVKCVPKPKDSE